MSQTDNTPTEIYLDMDGVLADFFAEYAKLAGVTTGSYRDIPPAKVDPTLDKMIGTDFFARLPMFKTVPQLLKLVLSYTDHYNICSSPLRGDNKNSEKHKRVWISKHLNPLPKDIIITGRKPKWATQPDGTPNILIDDRGKNIRDWIAAGGYGIKYQADEDSLETVKMGLDRFFRGDVQEPQDSDLMVSTRVTQEPKETYKRSELPQVTKEHLNYIPHTVETVDLEVVCPVQKELVTENLQKQYKRLTENRFAPIVVDKNYRIINGHHRYEVLKQLNSGYAEVARIPLTLEEVKTVMEKWSAKYKKSIDCSNPKGFSQKAHCAGRKKNEGAEITMWTNPAYQGADIDDDYYKKQPAKILDVSKLTPFEPADKMDDPISATNMGKLVIAIQAGKKIKPIVVVPHEGKLLIVDGHHRYFAHLKAGVDKIRAVMADPKDLTWRDDVPDSVKEENFDWVKLRTAKAVQPMLYYPGGIDPKTGKRVPPDVNQPNIITAVNLKQKLGPGEKLVPLSTRSMTDDQWQKYMDDWWTKNKDDPDAKAKIDQIKQSARDAGRKKKNENIEESIIVEHPAVIAALAAAGVTIRELVKRYGFNAVKKALDKAKTQKPNLQKPANDHGGYVDDLLKAVNKKRTPDEIARAQQMNFPRALDNAKAMIRHASKDLKAGKLSREEFTNIMRYLRVNFKRKTGKELPIDDLLKVVENFADGKKKGKSRPGRVKRAGASCKGSVTSLRKKAKNASGEKAKMYHWCANMKAGRNK